MRPAYNSFSEWSTAEKRLCAQRAAPERDEAPPSIDALKTDLRDDAKGIVKEMKEFLEQHQKDFAVSPDKRGLDIGKTPLMSRVRADSMGKKLKQLHEAIQKLKGDELTKRAGEFKDLLKELDGTLGEVGMELLCIVNGDNAESFTFMRVRFHYADHFDYHIAERRKDMPRQLPLPVELQDQEPGLRNDVVRQQTALRVARVQDQVATLERARDYLMHDPDRHLAVQREKIGDHFRSRIQKPPDYAIDTTMPPLADVQELGWALSAMYAEDPVTAVTRETEMQNMFISMGVIMEKRMSDWMPSKALVGQRRRVRGEGFQPIWEKTGPDKWECAVARGETKTDADIAKMNLAILNPRYDITFRKLSVRENNNEIEDHIRELQARMEIARQMRESARDTRTLNNARAEEATCAVEIRRLKEFNDRLQLPDERVIRHRAHEILKMTQEGIDEQEKPVQDLVTDINTRFGRMQKAGKGAEARAAWAPVSQKLLEQGLIFDEYKVGESEEKSVRLIQKEDLSGLSRTNRRVVQRRRADMQAFRDLTGALKRYLESDRKDRSENGGRESTTTRKALDDEHKASVDIAQRWKDMKGISDEATEKTMFEDRISRLLDEAGYEYRGFNDYGDLTFEYRGYSRRR